MEPLIKFLSGLSQKCRLNLFVTNFAMRFFSASHLGILMKIIPKAIGEICYKMFIQRFLEKKICQGFFQ